MQCDKKRAKSDRQRREPTRLASSNKYSQTYRKKAQNTAAENR